MNNSMASTSDSFRSFLFDLEGFPQKIESDVQFVSFTPRRAVGSQSTTSRAAAVHEPSSAAKVNSKEISAFLPRTSADAQQLPESSLSVGSLSSSHSNKTGERRRNQCPVCSLSFFHRSNLVKHAQIHSPRNGHYLKCCECDAWFKHESARRTHERAHNSNIDRSRVVKKRTTKAKKCAEDYSISSRSSTTSGPSSIVTRKAKPTGSSKNLEQFLPSMPLPPHPEPPPPTPGVVAVAQNAVVGCKERSSTCVRRNDKNVSSAAQHTLQSDVQNDAKIYNKITTFINMCSDQIKSANLSARSGNSSGMNDKTCDSDDAKRAAIHEILTRHVEAPLRRALLRVEKHDDVDEIEYEKVIHQMPIEKNLTALDLISDLEVLKNSCTLLAAQRMRPTILRACLIQALAVVEAIENAIRPTPLIAAKLE